MDTSKAESMGVSATGLWAILALFSIAWWIYAGSGSPLRVILLIAISLASFMVGTLLGFLFSSYGEELSTIGKIRDWLLGGITGLTLAEAIEQGGTIKRHLVTFAVGPGPNEFALVTSMAVVYVSLGFFVMFFQRELILNVLLAEKRAVRGRLDGTTQTGQAVLRLLVRLPASILTGVSDVEDIVDKQEADQLRTVLYSADVEKFLTQAAKAVSDGMSLEWDVVSKVAYIHYYRTYFEKENKPVEVAKALEWISRALTFNPLHADLTLKYADTLGAQRNYDSAVSILELLVLRPDAPVLVKQWLGYYSLFIPGREREAIEYSTEYLAVMPNDSDALFNIASGYAQLYCTELKQARKDSLSDSENRRKALEYLDKGLKLDPDFAETVRTKWIEKGESFDCFAKDDEFKAIVGLS